MEQYQLAHLYTNLRRAIARGLHADASRWLGLALGLDLPATPSARGLDLVRGGGLQSALTYRGYKPAELAILADDLKPAVKFEDIPADEARRFVERYRDTYQLTTSEPYTKDYLLLRTRRGPVAPEAALVAIYASRDDTARRLREVETSAREDFAACGELLGFPDCCVAAFAADFEVSRRDQDTLNDDACRRVLATGGPERPGHPALNPLSDFELTGFYPCSLHCPRAVAMARRAGTALVRARPGVADRMREQLTRPALFWRLPFFLLLDGHAEGESLVYTQARANLFPDPVVQRIQAWFAAHLLGLLAEGDRVVAQPDRLTVYRGDRQQASMGVDPTLPALAVAWQDWGERFFDPATTREQPTT